MAIEIPLGGGLVTQADAEEVGINACTVLENVEFDKPGLIYKRKGRGAAVTTTGKNFARLERWIAPNGTTYWIVIETTGATSTATNLADAGTFTSIGALGAGIRMLNYGSMLRFTANDALDSEPKVYQYIDRDYFWGQFDTSAAFNASLNRPVSMTVASHTLGKADMSGFYASTGFTHSTDVYSYKMTAVFDGNQEEPLPSGILGSSANPVGDVQCTGDDALAILLTITHSAFANAQRRITGINIYRQQNTGPYYKISSISTLENDANKIEAGATYLGKTFCDSSSSLTSAVNNHGLFVNGYKHDINASGFLDAEFAILDTDANWQVWGDNSDKYEDATSGDYEYEGHLNADDVTDPTTVGEVTGHLDLKFRSLSGDTTDTTSTVGGWFVGETPAKLYDADGSTYGAWTDASITVTQATDQFKYGTNCLKFDTDNNTANSAYYDLGTGFTGTDSLMVAFWFLMDGVDEAAATIKVGIGDTTAGSDKLFIDHDGLYTSGPGNKDKWRYIQSEFLVSSISGYAESDNLYFTVNIDDDSGSNAMIWIDNLVVAKKVINTTAGKLGMGTRVCSSVNLALGYEDVHAGSLMAVNNQVYDAVRHNLSKTIKTYRPKTQATGQTLLVGSQYLWMNKTMLSPAGADDTSYLLYVDKGDTDGAVHPTGETSLASFFRHSVQLEGRQYVADITLNPLSDDERHKDWVLFSELNQPDVIPISNYISIPDLEGGEIKALGRLIGDLVVFQTKGIYRLSIPSADPTSWSLSESEPHIGCIATDSVIEYEGGIFFAGSDHFYHLGSNFEAVPVTTTIKDVYQGTAGLSNTRVVIDVKKGRLLCKFGNTATEVYALDLSRFKQGQEHWSKILTPTDTTSFLTVDENLQVYTVMGTTNSKTLELVPSSESENTTFKRTTGWVSTPDMDKSIVLRRMSLRYNSGDAITAKFYIDGDASTVVKTITVPVDTSGADWYKCKPSVRCRMFMIELSSASSANDVEIRKLEVEFG